MKHKMFFKERELNCRCLRMGSPPITLKRSNKQKEQETTFYAASQTHP